MCPKLLSKGSIGLIFILMLLSLNLFAEENKVKIIIDQAQDETKLVPFKRVYKLPEVKKTTSPLALTSKDILWEYSPTGDYVDLIIKKKPRIQSVMLTNMYYGDYVKDYGHKVYGLKSRTYNPVNGNEKRIVNKKTIGGKKSQWFLVDSSPERHALFGWAYRIRIPKIVEYGYKSPGDNFGIISFEKGVTINLRTYTRKYADNRGKYINHSIHINFTQKDYYEKLKPNIKILKQYVEGDYKVVMVKYESLVEYVKFFLVRDGYQNDAFKRVGFTTGESRYHKSAFVIRSVRKEGEGISITALIYLQKQDSERVYEIAAEDIHGRTTKSYISVFVPSLGQPLDKDKEIETIPTQVDEKDDKPEFF